jgi:nucleoside-diphosphate kinase
MFLVVYGACLILTAGYNAALFMNGGFSVAVEHTLSIIKPDGTKRNLIGKIVGRFEEEGLTIAAMKKVHLSKREAEGFYAEHSARPFFGELVDFMTSGPVVLMALHGENAIARNREIMGATNPAEAAEGTIRKQFADSIGENTVHGSDAPASAAREIAYFFASTEIVG